MDPRIIPYARTVGQKVRSVLGSDLGVYVIGSAAMGGFDPDRSDVDMIVVTRRRTEAEETAHVVESLAHPTVPCPVRKLELVAYPVASLRGPRPNLEWDLNLNTGPEVGVEVTTERSSMPSHWFVLDVAMARHHAQPLVGPPPREVFPELDGKRIISALVESVGWHRENDLDGVQSVLNACRAWRYVTERTWVPKPDAARWARSRVPDPSLIGRVIEVREGTAEAWLDRAALARFLDDVEGRLKDSIRTAG